MREVEKRQLELGQVQISGIRFNPKSRDDVPAILIGLQHLYTDGELRARLFALLDAEILPERSRETGRPGMSLWNILVLAVVKLLILARSNSDSYIYRTRIPALSNSDSYGIEHGFECFHCAAVIFTSGHLLSSS